MEKNTIQEQVGKKEPKKYTVGEVLGSLYFEEVDHDDDFDGFIHLTSDIDGSGTKMDMSKLSALTAAEQRGRERERERIKKIVWKLGTDKIGDAGIYKLINPVEMLKSFNPSSEK